ncbi:MAG: hypothetical protein ACRCYQ_08720 [Nocardioides sp.]
MRPPPSDEKQLDLRGRPVVWSATAARRDPSAPSVLARFGIWVLAAAVATSVIAVVSALEIMQSVGGSAPDRPLWLKPPASVNAPAGSDSEIERDRAQPRGGDDSDDRDDRNDERADDDGGGHGRDSGRDDSSTEDSESDEDESGRGRGRGRSGDAEGSSESGNSGSGGDSTGSGGSDD